MTKQIATYFDVAETFITDLSVDGGYVDFRLNGVWYYARATKAGRVKTGSIRRG